MCAENVRTRAVVTFTPFWPNWRQAGGRLEAGWRQAGGRSRKDLHLFGQTGGRLEAMSACDDDRHFEILAELLHAGKGHSFEGLSSA